jgi:TRAP-type C4-dicarboxylate transport system substrate-binding protein
MLRATLSAVALALGCAAITACTSGSLNGGADKASGSEPVVLQLAVSDTTGGTTGARMVRYFAAQVTKLSHGQLRVEIEWDAGRADQTPFAEAIVARRVAAGTSDLGSVPSRAWDAIGANGFEALQTPFLITSQALMYQVATSPLAERMLATLNSHNLVGLALVPDGLRHPGGIRGSLMSLRDFAGATVLDAPSGVTDRLLRTLGARPVHIAVGAARDRAIAGHRLDGSTSTLASPSQGVRIITVNITLDPRFNTLIANKDLFGRLSRTEQGELRAAASQTLTYVLGTTPTEEATTAQFCTGAGRIALATPAQLRALRHAAQPAVTELERDPFTAAAVRQIRQLGLEVGPAPAFALPPACTRPLPGAPTGSLRPPSILNGTYHWRVTRAEALRTCYPAGCPDALPGLPAVNKIVLKDGRWTFPDPATSGTYVIIGDYLRLTSPRFNTTNTFTFTRSSDGTLKLTPVLPMDPGDQFVMTGGGASPWRRVGPPTINPP